MLINVNIPKEPNLYFLILSIFYMLFVSLLLMSNLIFDCLFLSSNFDSRFNILTITYYDEFLLWSCEFIFVWGSFTWIENSLGFLFKIHYKYHIFLLWSYFSTPIIQRLDLFMVSLSSPLLWSRFFLIIIELYFVI